MTTVNTKARQLRESSVPDLQRDLDSLKQELSTLRVAKVTGGAAGKVMKIKATRKAIARVLTVMTEKLRADTRDKYSGKKKPLDLRVKKTRAIRRRLTPAQSFRVVSKVQTRNANFPKRRYAVEA